MEETIEFIKSLLVNHESFFAREIISLISEHKITFTPEARETIKKIREQFSKGKFFWGKHVAGSTRGETILNDRNGLQLTGDLSSGIDPKNNIYLSKNISFVERDNFDCLLWRLIFECRYKALDKQSPCDTLFICIPKSLVVDNKFRLLKRKQSQTENTEGLLNSNFFKLSYIAEDNLRYLKKIFLLPTFLRSYYREDGGLEFAAGCGKDCLELSAYFEQATNGVTRRFDAAEQMRP